MHLTASPEQIEDLALRALAERRIAPSAEALRLVEIGIAAGHADARARGVGRAPGEIVARAVAVVAGLMLVGTAVAMLVALFVLLINFVLALS